MMKIVDIILTIAMLLLITYVNLSDKPTEWRNTSNIYIGVIILFAIWIEIKSINNKISNQDK